MVRMRKEHGYCHEPQAGLSKAVLHIVELAEQDERTAKAQLADEHWVSALVSEWLAQDRTELMRLKILQPLLRDAPAYSDELGSSIMQIA